MSFDRRWLLTAAGSAFLAGLARDLSGAPARPKAPAPSPGGTEADALFGEFKTGYGGMSAADEDLARKALDAIYARRLARIYPGLSAVEKERLNTFAVILGMLTRRCLENERNGVCGWEADKGAALRAEHVDRARELLGFHLNPNIKRRCGAALPGPGAKLRQPDQGCPLCAP